jgi:hypothetical protein
LAGARFDEEHVEQAAAVLRRWRCGASERQPRLCGVGLRWAQEAEKAIEQNRLMKSALLCHRQITKKHSTEQRAYRKDKEIRVD